MKLRILVFAEEMELRELLGTLLKQQGHKVQLFWGPSVCPLYRRPHDEPCRCPKEASCADAIIIDEDLYGNAVHFLRGMHRRRCRILGGNRALISADHTGTIAKAVAGIGCYLIRKPFRFDEIKGWVDACVERLAAHKPSE